jgi:hypothetical protein
LGSVPRNSIRVAASQSLVEVNAEDQVGGPGYSHDRAASTPTSGDKRSVNQMNAQKPAVPISRALRIAAAALPKLLTEGRDNLHV